MCISAVTLIPPLSQHTVCLPQVDLLRTSPQMFRQYLFAVCPCGIIVSIWFDELLHRVTEALSNAGEWYAFLYKAGSLPIT